MSRYLDKARKLMHEEAQGIELAAEFLNEGFDEIIRSILECPGRIFLTGIGKSGLIARKIAATFSSTGTPSIFLHPTEALHGDLGMIKSGDMIIMLSNSGETEELIAMVPTLREIGSTVSLITSRESSALIDLVDISLVIPELMELDTYNLAPTVSTTAMLALGDTIAIILMDEQKFSERDFALFHPSGSLGRKLTIKVIDLMNKGPDIPIVKPNTRLEETLFEISRKGLGATIVVDASIENKVIGIITDGDIRRCVQDKRFVWDLQVQDVMTKEPMTLNQDYQAIDALHLMEQKKISVLPIVDNEGNLCGILHLHQIIQAGIF
jgi:arabinose-5-phosphate isomerase